MSLTAILRGFRVPVAALDRYLQANGLMATFGDPPVESWIDPATKLFRAKLGDDKDDSRTRLFVPFRKGRLSSDLAYVAYDWVMVYAQRQVNLEEELLKQPPLDFAELRDEIFTYADGASGQQKVEDLSALFVIIVEEAIVSFKEPYLRKSDLRCDQCEATFSDWFEKQQHRRDVHGSTEGTFSLPRDI